MSNKQKNFMAAIPTFVRNVMGSSAGAGSGEFHVYRHLRRKEYARQKHIQHKSRQVNLNDKRSPPLIFVKPITIKYILYLIIPQEELDDEYQQRLESNRINSESKTAKKRAKRQKRKLKAKNKPKGTAGEVEEPENDISDDSEDDETESAEKKAKPSDEATDVQLDDENSKDAPITVKETTVIEEDGAVADSAQEATDGPFEKVAPRDCPFDTVTPEEPEVDIIAEVVEPIAGCAERAVRPADAEATTET